MTPHVFRATRLAPVLLALLLAGCGGSGSDGDRAAEANPYIRRARERAAEKDTAGAIQFYKRALAEDPELSRAHLELAILHDEAKEYVGAIYHYGAYLDLKPNVDATQRKWVEDSIRHAKYSLVTEMPVNPGARKTMEDLSLRVEELRVQNAKLIEIIRQLERQVPAGTRVAVPDLTPLAARAPRTAGGAPAPAPAPAGPARVIPSEYKVTSGDSLSTIAKKVYGESSKWTKIRDANPDKRMDRLKPGDILKIPQ